jgi:hypothetical protein
MYKILTVYSQISVKSYIKNRGETAVITIERDVYKDELQRAGWALPRPFLYTHLIFQKK